MRRDHLLKKIINFCGQRIMFGATKKKFILYFFSNLKICSAFLVRILNIVLDDQKII